MVHGLLTASLATEAGSLLSFMAQDFNLTFRELVRSGDEVTLEMSLTSMDAKGPRASVVTAAATFVNQHGAQVASLATKGLIRVPLQELLTWEAAEIERRSPRSGSRGPGGGGQADGAAGLGAASMPSAAAGGGGGSSKAGGGGGGSAEPVVLRSHL